MCMTYSVHYGEDISPEVLFRINFLIRPNAMKRVGEGTFVGTDITIKYTQINFLYSI